MREIIIALAKLVMPHMIRVMVEFEGGSTHEFIMTEFDLDAFVAATVRLHYEPGVNPHNGEKTSQVKKISKRTFVWSGDAQVYWWSSPDLGTTKDSNGAMVWTPGLGASVVWSASEAEIPA